ncbi:MAG TPA: hypothetical protein VK550_28290 [Polyangiaceae bacterium]|nr:hypothetical protein [Polyangiaceae bacterium]
MGGASGSAGMAGSPSGGVAGRGGAGGANDGSGATGGMGGVAGGGNTGGAGASDASAGTGGASTLDSGDDGVHPDIGEDRDAGRDAADDGGLIADSYARDACPTSTCAPPNGRYCGVVGDGCGGSVDCGSCPSGQVCGARVPNVCDAPCPLCAQIPQCPDAGTTTITGTVFTGAATSPDPVYKATVFIPNIGVGAKLPPVASGPSCERCPPLGWDKALASAVTGPDGTFTLQNVPAGTGIPLVVQLGKWRYETTITVLPCTQNILPTGTARLPRTQLEGNIPRTAISTGNVDALECILRKIGVADSEFSNPTGSGRIHFYRNNGARFDATTPAQGTLVDTPAAWDRYDQVLFPCEGMQSNETAGALTNFIDYTSKGGRAFTTHFSYTWLYQNGGFATAGTWQVNQQQPPSPLISNIDTTMPKGQDFATWLGLVGALSNPTPPQVAINDPRRNLNAVPVGQGGQRWIYTDNPATVQHMVVDTPVAATPDKLCGRVIYSDFHVANAMNGNLTFPAQCPTNDLTPQEKILEFMLFDLAACIGPTTSPPPAPPRPPAAD